MRGDGCRDACMHVMGKKKEKKTETETEIEFRAEVTYKK